MIDVQSFLGMAPKQGVDVLQPNQAAYARNSTLNSGELRPSSLPTIETALSDIAASIFCTRAGVWLAKNVDTEWVEAPEALDMYSRVYFANTNGVYVSAPSIWSGGAGNLPQVQYQLGQPAPAAAPGLSQSGTPSGTPETRYYAYTRVSIWGEESPPSPLAGPITITPAESATLSGFAAVAAGYVPTYSYRIYRTSTGATSTDLLFVGETVNTSFVDTVVTAALGAPISTVEYDPPPAGLRGLTLLPGGSLAGVVGRYVYFSEPYMPHAWPTGYRKSFDTDAIAVGAFDNTVAVATLGRPYLANGRHPDDLIFVPLIDVAACSNAKSLSVTSMGITWATKGGPYTVGPQGNGYLAEKVVGAKEWAAYYPATMAAQRFAGGYVARYARPDGSGGMVLFMPDAGMSESTYAPLAITTKQDDTALFCLDPDGVSILRIESYHGNAVAEWKSKRFSLPPVNLHYLRVTFDGSGLTQTINFINGYVDDATIAGAVLGNDMLAADSAMPYISGSNPSVVVDIYGDGVLVTSETVVDSEPIPFYSDGLSRFWEFVVNTNVPVSRIQIAPDIEGVLA